MSKFLMTVWPFTGHIYPNLAVADALRKRGHDVAFFTGSSARPMVESAGFSCFVFEHVDEATVERIVLSPSGILAQRGAPGRMRALWRQWVLDTIPDQVADLTKVVDLWQPDAIVCDPTMWGPFLIARETCNVPVAIFSLIPACYLSGQDSPILGFPLPRPRTPFERLRNRALRRVSRLALMGVRREANRLRARYGLSPLQTTVTDHAGTLPLYLVPGSPEFDYDRRDLPPSVHYVGACLWQNRHERAPEWLDRIPANRPVVYVSEGTIKLDAQVLRAAAVGLANLPVEVVITTGRHRDPASLDLGRRPLAPNIRVERWVPLESIVDRLSAIVTVGGPSTLMAALARGIPVVIVPFDWDHPETAWRVADSGAGVRLGPESCTPAAMRDAVERVLNDPSYKRNAERVSATLARCGGPGTAAALLETLTQSAPAGASWRVMDGCPA